MAKKKTTVLDFDNDQEVVDEFEKKKNLFTNINNTSDIDNKNKINNKIDNEIASNIDNTIKNTSNSDSILSSVLSKTTKEPKKVYTGFYLEEPVVKMINKIVKDNKETNKSKLVNDLLTEAFKQAGLMK
ncbi:hypothetical protein [Bacillus toyonensis]|uniref:Uncharacterized protein n=1 Tax=Bacillus toyonensis TaxID=155322 RepID=A0A2A8HIV3_9BACI|nr:hypothetical protein [Bacillus toyonensis]PEQ08686.1 hypothetical protein CN585_07990 [Bacillus toyonensis]